MASLLNRPSPARVTPESLRRTAQLCEALEPRQLLAAEPFAVGNTIVEMQTNFGNIWVELFDTETPNHVTNFLSYVNANRYDNTFFHRSEPTGNNVLQGGGYVLDSFGAPQEIQTFASIGLEAKVSNKARTLGMARTSDVNSATSQFYFNYEDNLGFDKTASFPGYTVFGQVVKGWDVALRIRGLDTTNAGSGFENVPIVDEFQGGALGFEDLVQLIDVRVIQSTTWSQEANGGAPVRGAGDSTGQSVFITVNEQGRPIAFYQSNQSQPYTVTDLSIMTGTAGNLKQVSKVQAWFDTKDSLFYAAATTTDGVILYRRDARGYWTARNLTVEIAGSEKIASDITVFKSTDNVVHLAGMNSSGEVLLYQQSSKTANAQGNFPWSAANLSVRDLAPQGLATPRYTSDLVSYVTSWNGLNIAGLDNNGDVQTVWWAPGLQRWQTSNLSDITGAATLSGGLTAYVTSYDAVNIVGTDTTGSVLTTWWLPSFGGEWRKDDLTAIFEGPKLVAASVASYVTSWDGTNIVGLDTNGKLIVYWWAPGITDNKWQVTNMSDFITGSIPLSGKVTGVAAPSGFINLMGAKADGKVARYSWSPTTPWAVTDLSTNANFFA